MAQPQANIQIAAPGFMGLNTQDSPVGLPLEYASVADNCIIDRFGRIGSRKGMQILTTNANNVLADKPIESCYEFIDLVGKSYLFGCGNNKVFIQDQSSPYELEALVVTGATIVADNWQMQGLDDRCYFVQTGYPIMEFLATVPTDLKAMVAQPTAGLGTPNCITAGFGFLFVGGFSNNKSMVAYSILSEGAALTWEGYINLTQYWPAGVDEVVGMEIHNDFLIVFGKRSILVYSIPDTGPTDISLVDTITGVGCLARDSIKVIGTDIQFVDSSGVRSLARTIQEKSMPLGEVSMNVKQDISDLIFQEQGPRISTTFDPKEALYSVHFPTYNTSYVFDTRGKMENGTSRTTRWPNLAIWCGTSVNSTKAYYGGLGGFYEYTGANDLSYIESGALAVYPGQYAVDPSIYPINLKYYTHPQTFDSPANLKFPKQFDMTLFGSIFFEMVIYWAFDYANTYNKYTILKEGFVPAEYTVSEYNNGALYGGSSTQLRRETVNLWGSGTNIKFGFETTVDGTPFSIQELNIQALQGRMI